MIIEIAAIIGLLLCLTVSVGINIVSVGALKLAKEDLPEVAYKVGSALIDDKLQEFIGDTTAPAAAAAAGRPVEGLERIIIFADKLGILKPIVNKFLAQDGSRGDSFIPGLGR